MGKASLSRSMMGWAELQTLHCWGYCEHPPCCGLTKLMLSETASSQQFWMLMTSLLAKPVGLEQSESLNCVEILV
jgi:hypothetical protein